MGTPDHTAVLHRVEALPGDGRYAVTFRRGDGSEQSAVAQLADGAVRLPEASLPVGLPPAALRATTDTVVALDAARRIGAPSGGGLRDVDGGWDVGLGNVVLAASGVPECTAHGELADDDGVWVCAECGARALL